MRIGEVWRALATATATATTGKLCEGGRVEEVEEGGSRGGGRREVK